MSSPNVFLGIVKQVLSGDSIVIRDRPVDGPPPERTIALSNISCGRLARRPTPSNPNPGIEDPFAWQAREFVRSKVIGKEVCYTIETELPSGRKYGSVYIGKTTSGENIALSLVQEGFAEIRKLNAAAAEKNATYQELVAAEEQAKTLEKGRWGAASDAVRDVVWTLEDTREFVDKMKGQRIPAVVEYVRDGSTMQVTMLPESPGGIFHNVMLSLSGIRCPSIRFENGEQVAEPFGLDAQFFVESRLLQRDVIVLLESTMNQNFIGSVLHPNGNIAEILVGQGLAKCIDWNLSLVSVPGAAEAYKSAERAAKEKHSRIWKDYQIPVAQVGTTEVRDPNQIIPGTCFNGRIVEVGNGDNVSVKCADSVVRKFFLSSIRMPRPAVANKEDGSAQARGRIRPLYDVPYVFEAREHLRSFIGKTVNVSVDYIQPKTATSVDERVCSTVKQGIINLAESLVAKGLANVIRYRGANDARSNAYAELLAAEELAQTDAIGLYSKQEAPVHRVADLSGNLTKSRQFLPFLKRTPQISAVVEFVVYASRMRVYLPRETCLVTLLLSGIQCPRKGRTQADGKEEPDMPFSVEAHNYVKELCMQRDVTVTMDTMDRVGNFVGWLFLDAPSNETDGNDVSKSTSGKKKKKAADAHVAKPKVNLSVLLVSQGLAYVHRAASTEASPYYHELLRAEETAKANSSGLWSSDEFIKQWETRMSEANDAANANGAEEVGLMSGGVVNGYLDDLSMLNINGTTNEGEDKDTVGIMLAVQYDMVPCATETLKPVPGVMLKVPLTSAGGSATSPKWLDIVETMLEEGLVCVEPMRMELQKQASRTVLSGYLEAQAKAKKERKNIWRYGDFRIDTNQ